MPREGGKGLDLELQCRPETQEGHACGYGGTQPLSTGAQTTRPGLEGLLDHSSFLNLSWR